MKIAFFALRNFDELAFCKQYSAFYGIDYVWTSEYPNPDNLRLAKECVGVSFTPCLVTEKYVDVFKECGVKYFLCRSIGYDHLPCKYIRDKGMHIATSPYPTECVADYALMLILMTTRKVQQTMIRAAAQDYTLKGKMGRAINSCTVGVIGTGHIGSVLVKHLAPLGCTILVCDPYQKDELKKYARYVELDELLAKSDVISLHLPASDSTFHMINTQAINKMKDGVIIVNTARGTLIDSKALIAGLKSGKIGGAALDVLENENGLYYYNRCGDNIDNDELAILRSFPNVICTPHTAFYVESTVANMIKKAFMTIDYYRRGEPYPNEIDLSSY